MTQIASRKPTTAWKELGEDKPYFKDEIDMEARIDSFGLIGTSNTGPGLNNSEFFITLTKANLTSLNGKHTIFGRIEEGAEVLKKINENNVDATGRPQMNIRILHTFILDDPFDDPEGLEEP